MPQIERQVHTLPTRQDNAVRLVFTHQLPTRVLLGRYVENDIQFYDGFGGPYNPNPKDSLAAEKAASYHVQDATGLSIPPNNWRHIISLVGDTFETLFFYAYAMDMMDALDHSSISLEVPDSLPMNTIHTLKWLIPLALDDGIIKPLGLQGI